MVTDCPFYNSKLITYSKADPFAGLEMQLLIRDSEVIGYLNIYCGSLTSETTIRIQAEETTLFNIKVMEGGQKVLLSPEALEFIIANLNENKTLRLSIGRYSVSLVPSNFQKLYSGCTSIFLTWP